MFQPPAFSLFPPISRVSCVICVLSDSVSGIFSAIPYLFSVVLFMLSDPVPGVISLLSNPVTGVTCKSVSIVICTLSNPVSGDMLSDPVSGVISVRCQILSPALPARCLIRFWRHLCAQSDPVSGIICSLSDPVPGVISLRCLIRFPASSLYAV